MALPVPGGPARPGDAEGDTRVGLAAGADVKTQPRAAGQFGLVAGHVLALGLRGAVELGAYAHDPRGLVGPVQPDVRPEDEHGTLRVRQETRNGADRIRVRGDR